MKYRSVPGKRPLLGKRPCTSFQGVNVAATIQTYGNYVPGKCPCGPKSRCMFKRPWALTQDTTVSVVRRVLHQYVHIKYSNHNYTFVCLNNDVPCIFHEANDKLAYVRTGVLHKGHYFL